MRIDSWITVATPVKKALVYAPSLNAATVAMPVTNDHVAHDAILGFTVPFIVSFRYGKKPSAAISGPIMLRNVLIVSIVPIINSKYISLWTWKLEKQSSIEDYTDFPWWNCNWFRKAAARIEWPPKVANKWQQRLSSNRILSVRLSVAGRNAI